LEKENGTMENRVKATKIRDNYFTSQIIKFRELGLLVFIVLLAIVINVRNPNFLTATNIIDMLKDTTILSILAVGMMLVIVTRGIDLSVGSTLALTGMIVGMIVSSNKEIPAAIAVLIGVVMGILLGAITGLVVSKGNVLPIIATLGIMNIYRGITFIISGGKWVNAHQMPESFKNMTRQSILGINTLILFAVVIYIIFYYFVNHTRTGRQIYAVGSNPDAAKISGIAIDRILFLVYTLMGGLSGLSGVLWVSRYASAQNDTATGFELFVIAACVLGGVNIAGGSGKISGVLLGSILIGIINNALPMVKISPFWKLAIQGLIIIIAVLVNVLIARRIEKKNLMRRNV